jgi:hypothetical protein
MTTTLGARATLIASLLLTPAAAQEPRTSVREFVNAAGTVERVDRTSRMLTFKGDQGISQSVYVPPDLKIFDDLNPGDTIVARIRESVVVSTRPGLKPQAVKDTTAAAAANKRDATDPDVLQQITAVVTIENIDPAARVVTYKTADNRRVARAVLDPRLLEGLKPGDVIEVTLTRERVIELQRR